MLSYTDFISNKMFDEASREQVLENITKTIDKIQFYDKSIEDIDLSEQTFYELFSNQKQYDSLREIVKDNFSKYFPDQSISQKFMKDQDNQLLKDIAIVPSSNCNLNENIKFTFNQLKYYDIQISKPCSSFSCYFQKQLFPQNIYIFRVKSQDFLKLNKTFKIGLIKTNNINLEVFILISAINNQYANTIAEELEFRISLDSNIISLEAFSYPFNNLISRKTLTINQEPIQYKQQVTGLFGQQTGLGLFAPQQQSNFYYFGIQSDKLENTNIKLTYFKEQNNPQGYIVPLN